jgi:hypothetical protein
MANNIHVLQIGNTNSISDKHNHFWNEIRKYGIGIIYFKFKYNMNLYSLFSVWNTLYNNIF